VFDYRYNIPISKRRSGAAAGETEMTNQIAITERTNVKAGEDRFEVAVDGVVFTTHPTLRGATKIAARLSTGWRG
jgi:hypothetical protein